MDTDGYVPGNTSPVYIHRNKVNLRTLPVPIIIYQPIFTVDLKTVSSVDTLCMDRIQSLSLLGHGYWYSRRRHLVVD